MHVSRHNAKPMLAAVVFSVRSYLSVRFGVSADLIFCEAWKDFFVFSVVRWKKQALLQTLACVSACAVCKCACKMRGLKTQSSHPLYNSAKFRLGWLSNRQ